MIAQALTQVCNVYQLYSSDFSVASLRLTIDPAVVADFISAFDQELRDLPDGACHT